MCMRRIEEADGYRIKRVVVKEFRRAAHHVQALLRLDQLALRAHCCGTVQSPMKKA